MTLEEQLTVYVCVCVSFYFTVIFLTALKLTQNELFVRYLLNESFQVTIKSQSAQTRRCIHAHEH